MGPPQRKLLAAIVIANVSLWIAESGLAPMDSEPYAFALHGALLFSQMLQRPGHFQSGLVETDRYRQDQYTPDICDGARPVENSLEKRHELARASAGC